MNKLGALLLCLAITVAVVNALAGQDYTGHKMVRAYLENEKQVGIVESWELDVWTRESTLAIGWNDIVVNDEHITELHKLEVAYDIIIDDMVAHLEAGQRDLEESRKHQANNVNALPDFFTTYHTNEEFAAYLQLVVKEYPTVAKYIPTIGKTIQGRDIFGITLGTSAAPKYKLFVNGGQHAREWISPATVAYIITQLASQYSTNSAVKSLLDTTSIDIIPIVNQDGYNYTWLNTNNRLWRKNRRANVGGTYGVDLNRNWNEHWGGVGASKTPSSDTYCGTGPFSEPESTAVSKFVLANGPYKGAIDYHSYSQLILRPYGWTNTPPKNEALAKTVGDTIRARILAVNNVAYTSQASWQLYYTTGSAQDWYFNTTAGPSVPLSYTIELRDTGTYGFQLPAAQIKPTGAENWAGFLYFAQTAIAN